MRELHTQVTGWMLHNQQSFITGDVTKEDRLHNLDSNGLPAQACLASLLQNNN